MFAYLNVHPPPQQKPQTASVPLHAGILSARNPPPRPDRFSPAPWAGRGRFAGTVTVFVFLAAKQVRGDGDYAVLRQFITQTAHPIGQTENFLNHKHNRSFVFSLGINDERLDRAVARFDIDPVRVTRRSVQTVFAEILDLLRRNGLNQQKSAKAKAMCFIKLRILVMP